MKYIILIFTTMALTMNTVAQNGQANTIKKTFSRETIVSIKVNADPDVIWNLLINSDEYPKWNSTIVSIGGTIAEGEKIRLVSTLDTNRTFKLKIKEFESNKRLVWGDAMGKRVFSLKPQDDGTTIFTMREKIGGPMFPLFAKMIPPFDESFEQFASDLKKAAETRSKN